MNVVHIARCPDHGLHGARRTCFICEREVEQVAMVTLEQYEALREALGTVLDAIDAMPGVHNPNRAVGYSCARAREFLS